MTVEVEPTEAPNIADLASPGAVAGLVGWLAPLQPPSGATDLTRAVYSDHGNSIWTFGRADARRGETGAAPAPGVLFVHGGGWGGGAPALHLRHAFELAERGYVTALIDYRLAPAWRWPAPLEDVRAALGWLRSSAGALGLDPERLAVAGGSAGGHLSAMAALDPALDLKAAVLWYPAVDLRAFDTLADARPMVEALLGGSYSDEVMLAASPVAHVAPGAPPMLTMTGDDDALTTVADITRFHELLDDAGAANELVVFKSRDHGFDYHPADWTVCQARMTAFLDRVL